MEQLESTNSDLQSTSERLHTVEAQRLAAVRETEAQRQHVLTIESEHRGLLATLKVRCVPLMHQKCVHAHLSVANGQLGHGCAMTVVCCTNPHICNCALPLGADVHAFEGLL